MSWGPMGVHQTECCLRGFDTFTQKSYKKTYILSFLLYNDEQTCGKMVVRRCATQILLSTVQ